MKKTYSVSETAKILGYSTNSIYGFLKEGLINSVRIGKGKFRIPELEIKKFEGNKGEGEIIESKEKPTTSKKEGVAILSQQDVLPSALLPTPRPGKSLSDLSGESFLHTMRLWLVERVGFPTLFDWLISLTSIVLGMSLFLYSNQQDVLSLGRLSLWLNPVRLGMIFGGFGLILASMIQEEVGRTVNLTNIFRYFLGATFLGLAVVLFSGGDIDGFLIHGLFGLVILIEALSEVESSTLYMLYIFGLLISVFIALNFFPDGSDLSVVTLGLKSVFGGLGWLLSLLILVLIAFGLYGFFWNKRFLKSISFAYGLILCSLALYYGIENYWSRFFATLIAGLIGMVLPSWDSFKARLVSERTLVFKVFGSVLMCFILVILMIAVVQGTLISNANRGLSEKADFARVELSRTIDGLTQGVTDLSKNEVFIKAFVRSQSKELADQLKFLSLGRTDVAIAGVVEADGEPIASYPASATFSLSNFAGAEFFNSTLNTGKTYVSMALENLIEGVDNVFLIAVPTVNTKNVVSGVLFVAVSGVNLSSELQRVGDSTLGQEVVVVGEGGKMVVHPNADRLGVVVNEADGSYDLWKTNAVNMEGYNWRGLHSLFGSSKLSKYGLTVIVSEPVQKVLDVNLSWLTWLLILFLIIGIVMLTSIIFIKTTRRMGEK
ncbi:TPA: hypothetical protein DCS00_02425 [Candidatus Collierbacteria bacterium]|nr:hypothetical protein [Candidatus Collierbacteria bacterium]